VKISKSTACRHVHCITQKDVGREVDVCELADVFDFTDGQTFNRNDDCFFDVIDLRVDRH